MIDELDAIEARLEAVRIEVLELVEPGYREALATFQNGRITPLADVGEPSRDGIEGRLG